MTSERMRYDQSKERLGFSDSLDLASKIVKGSLRLFKQYPKLLLPLLPILALVLLLEASILFVNSLFGFGLFMLALFVVAYALMLSFAISSQMLKQINSGDQPSIVKAIFAPEMPRMLYRVFGLSVIWYFLVIVLVTIELIVGSLLNRLSDGLGDAVMSAVFGTIADALRMAGFMMVTIMTFEDIGLGSAFSRLRAILKNRSIAALSGLGLIKIVTGLIFLVIFVMVEFLNPIDIGPAFVAIIFTVMIFAWLLSMYLEQLFAAGLYLYEAAPQSRVVGIMLDEVLGNELPLEPSGL